MSVIGGGQNLGTATSGDLSHLPKMKVCYACGRRRQAKNFHIEIPKRTGRARLRSSCKQCSVQKVREWAKKNPEKVKAKAKREQHLRRARRVFLKFGITQDEYDKMLEEQSGLCAVCFELERVSIHGTCISNLAIDHDHKTGKIRGLVCFRCNIIMGHLKDDPELARQIADYLISAEVIA